MVVVVAEPLPAQRIRIPAPLTIAPVLGFELAAISAVGCQRVPLSRDQLPAAATDPSLRVCGRGGGAQSQGDHPQSTEPRSGAGLCERAQLPLPVGWALQGRQYRQW